MNGTRGDSPTSFGKYRVTELIGEGGFGRVYLGWDPGLKRPVAIKTCSLRQEDMRERFFREAEIAAGLRHANITTVYDFGDDGGDPYLVQEYLSGEDLDRIVKRPEPIPMGTKIRYLLQIAEGLRYAHSKGVVHRDVKPANIRVLGDGQLRIMDFGIAKLVEETQRLTQVGMTIGTAGYLSPEQLQGLDVDPRADIFSFGILAYELLTLRRPFEADSVSALFYAISHVDPPPMTEVWPDCPAKLAATVSRCLEKDRDRRYQDLGEVIRDLSAVQDAGAMQTASGSAGPGGATVAKDSVSGAMGVPRPPDGSDWQPPSAGGGSARRRLGPLLGLGVVTVLVAAFGVLNLARWGESEPSPGDLATPARDAGGPVAEGEAREGVAPEGQGADATGGTTGVAAGESGSAVGSGRGTAPESPSVPGEPPSTPAEDISGEVSAATPLETGAAAAGAVPAGAPDDAPVEGPTAYRGTHTLVLLWSDVGDPGAATTAETAFLDEFRRRDLAVAEPAALRMLGGDAATRGAARTGDAGVLVEVGRAQGAELLLTGSLRTEAAPSVGGMFTGTAVLDVRVYRVSTAELLAAETYRVGTGGIPGKLGPSTAAAEAEAAREAGARAAIGLARALGPEFPRGR